MKFKITPDRHGQIARKLDDPSNTIYIVVELPSDDNHEVTVVELDDLQRHALDISKVTRLKHSSANLTVLADCLESYVASWNFATPVPRDLKAYFIQNIEDVKQYFRDLHEIYDCEFHPDDDFNDFTNANDEQTFTSDEAAYLNSVMIQSFDICDRNDVEIYDVAGEVQIEVWTKKGLWP